MTPPSKARVTDSIIPPVLGSEVKNYAHAPHTPPSAASHPGFSPVALPSESSALHRELGAAIAATSPKEDNAIISDASTSLSDIPDFNDPASSYDSFTPWELTR